MLGYSAERLGELSFQESPMDDLGLDLKPGAQTCSPGVSAPDGEALPRQDSEGYWGASTSLSAR